MRYVGLVVMLAVLSACGQGTAGSETSVRTLDRATVTDVAEGAGPILCEGAVRESAPPQCDGPVVSNWDWSKVWGASGPDGARFGEFCLTGKDVGEQFEVTEPPRPVGTCGLREYVAYATVLEDGGTFGPTHGPQLCLGPVMLSFPVQCGGPDITNWRWELVDGWTKRAKTIDGFYTVHGTYADGDFTLTRPPAPLEPGQQPLPSPSGVGASGGEYSDRELRRIQAEVHKRVGKLMLVSSPGNDRVEIDVVIDEDGRLQKEFDEKYGKGVVRVTSALRPVSPGM